MVQNLSFNVRPDPYGHYREAVDQRLVRERQAEEQRRAEETRSVNSAMAQSIGNQDWEGLQAVGAKSGDPDVATAARSRAAEGMFQQAYQAANELGQIATLPPEQRIPAYQRWRGTVLSRAQRMGVLNAEAQARFDQEHPAQIADPEQVAALAERARAQVAQLANQQHTPESYLSAQAAQARADREELRDDRRYQNERDRIDQGERRLEAAIARGGNGDGMSNTDIRSEMQFSDRWRGVYNNFSEIRDSYQRVQSMGNLGNAAGDLALVVSFTKMLDPGSVAREGEVALTQSAASALAQAQNFLPRLSQGNTLLPAAVRQQLIGAAREMYGNYERTYNNLATQYRGTAQAYGFDPNRVMMGYQQPGAAPAGGGGGNVSPPQVGETREGYRFRGGDPANPASWEPVR